MSVETTIRTLRHAQSTYSPDQRYAGSTDVPLSDAGARDCQRSAEALAGLSPDVIVTSTMKRSIDTSCLLRCEAPVQIQTELCNERRFGVLEGLTWQEAQHLDPPILFIEVGDDRHSVNPPGGEPFEDVWQRAKKFRRFLFGNFRGSSILVVSHGVFLQMFHGVLRGGNCVESLISYPATLELTTFRFHGSRLVDEAAVRLRDDAGQGF